MPSAKGSRFGIVASRFNPEITDRLLQGALGLFRQKGIARTQVRVVRVPGAFELAGAAARMAGSGRYKAIVVLGCILEGETPHYRYLSQSTLTGVMMAGILTGVPVTCGVITVRDWKLALDRSQPKGLNRGREAAKAAWELVHADER